MSAMWLLEQWVGWRVTHSGLRDLRPRSGRDEPQSHHEQCLNQMLHPLDMCVHLSDFVSNLFCFFFFFSLNFVL